MKAFFPESLDQKHGCILYMGAHYTRQKYGKSLSNNNNNLHSDSITCQELLIHLIHTKNPTK